MYLCCHTHFSMLYGTLSPAELFNEARRNQVHKLVIADINNTSAFIEMQRFCIENRDEYDLEVIPGIEFRRDHKFLYAAIAMNESGFEEINTFLSKYNLQQDSLPDLPPRFHSAYVIFPGGSRDPSGMHENEFIGIRAYDLNRIRSLGLEDKEERLVIWHPVTFASKTGYNVHRLLRAIDSNTLLSKLPAELQAPMDEYMIPETELLKYYWQFPVLISNTKMIIETSHVDLQLGVIKNKKTFTGIQEKDHFILRNRALAGFRRRYTEYDSYAMSRLLKELDVIAERKFEAYFLISLDIVEFAKSRGFAHVGRGSGANSMVAYCLGITDVDPVELDLYFERFLNPYRSSPPDFDIDFSWKDRDTVTEYVINKYRGNAALLATYTTFQGRSIIRELGKVFGLPKREIDTIIDYPKQNQHRDDITRLIFQYARYLHDRPRNLSIHAGGILITEKPITAYTALDLPPKGFPITHFDMISAEDLGANKFDILSQRGLGHIKEAVELIKKNKGIDVDIHRFREIKEDKKVNRLLQEGRAMGCFYIESPAMRMLLGKLGCDNYLTLVAASSIIRPGVARSGMMREYIYRHLNPGKYDYLHPKMEELMKETYGIMVYQEDVIKVAHHFADLDLAEADILRRGMSGKFRSRKEFQRVEDKFFKNCKAKKYPEEIFRELWRQIESFAGYSFSKAHSASYAVESYQSLFLKAYHPYEFMVAVINNFGGFYRTEFYFHEARMAGARIEAPCVNRSDYLTNIHQDTIFIGFIHLKSLEIKIGEKIVDERNNHGHYRDFDDFLQRISTGLEQIRILIRAGAFRFTGKSKRELLWEAHFFFGKPKTSNAERNLFDVIVKKFNLPQLEKDAHEDAYDELELLGFTLTNPFGLLKPHIAPDTMAATLMDKIGKQVIMAGYLVTTKNTYTTDHKLMHFGTFIDEKGQVFDTTHFPDTASKFPFRGKGFYLLKGKVAEDFNYPMVEINYMEKLPILGPDRKEYDFSDKIEVKGQDH
ncbi:MAG: DNA polymerase III subunit alpha [Cyclobacteriaceae bacterium]|nr:DNA polymerase III subunit alpha [Cyclobacteriaceae bacterium]